MATQVSVIGSGAEHEDAAEDADAFDPDASGVALGFDRLVMLATQARRIDDVLWTPVP